VLLERQRDPAWSLGARAGPPFEGEVKQNRKKRIPAWTKVVPKGSGGIPSGTVLSGRDPKRKHRKFLKEDQRYFSRVVLQLVEVLRNVE
jgi:hypothetical protein